MSDLPEGKKQDAEHVVPYSVFDTEGLAPRNVFSLWQEQMESMADVRLAKDCDLFHARAEAAILDQLVLGHVRSTTFGYDRSRFRIARDGLDHYLLHFFRGGRLICRKTGTGGTIKPGDMMLADMANPELATIVDMDVIYLVVPRPLMAPLLAEPEARGLRHFSGDNVLVKLLYDHVSAILSQARSITVQQARALGPAMLQLAAAAINGAVGEETQRGVASSLFQAISRHVRVRAHEAGFSSDDIAAHFGISPRKLSYLFEQSGGIASHIQHERLRLARQALMDPAQRSKTVQEIAEACGFLHRTSFIRAFERVYSLTPGQQRSLAADRRRTDPDELPEPSPIRWIAHV